MWRSLLTVGPGPRILVWESRMDASLLLERARGALELAHAPFSNYRVGAALLTTAGDIFTGCNIESSSYGLTQCAERVALFKAVSEGHRAFQAIAVVSADGPCTPCGACRQLLWDFAPDLIVITEGPDGTAVERPLSALLPYAFDARFLKKSCGNGSEEVS